MIPSSASAIQDAFLAACRDELSALKPGNVHIHAAGHGMTVAEFERAAEAAAPFVADPRLRVGERIRRAVEASLAAAGCNTNLGILLLSVPLAAAVRSPSPRLRGEGWGLPSAKAEGEGRPRAPSLEPAPHPNPLPARTGRGDLLRGRAGASPPVDGKPDTAGALRASLGCVLSNLDIDDAADVFAAIALAKPAGLGAVEEEDVAHPPTVNLRQAMTLAAGRDRIARAYVTDFEDVFDLGLPALEEARRHARTTDLAVTTLHMAILAALEDSHIARKYGQAAAIEVREAAQARRGLWHPAVSPASLNSLRVFDRELKHRNLNPGTTADFVVATLFSERLIAAIRAQECA